LKEKNILPYWGSNHKPYLIWSLQRLKCSTRTLLPWYPVSRQKKILLTGCLQVHAEPLRRTVLLQTYTVPLRFHCIERCWRISVRQKHTLFSLC
jgi:hypothetical protein